MHTTDGLRIRLRKHAAYCPGVISDRVDLHFHTDLQNESDSSGQLVLTTRLIPSDSMFVRTPVGLSFI